jgi:hypothetical protein
VSRQVAAMKSTMRHGRMLQSRRSRLVEQPEGKPCNIAHSDRRATVSSDGRRLTAALGWTSPSDRVSSAVGAFSAFVLPFPGSLIAVGSRQVALALAAVC